MKPTAVGEPDRQNFIDLQYGTDQTALDADVVIPGVSTKIPYYNRNHFCIYQPNNAQAILDGFDGTNAPGYEYFINSCTEINSNDVTWDYVDVQKYKFVSAPIGQQFRQLEIFTGTQTQSIGNAQYYNANRQFSNVGPNGDFTIIESFGPSRYSTVPLVTYSSSVMEKGVHFVKGDMPNKPARQPSYHIGMRSIEKNSPELNTFRAGEWVLANIEFEIEATMLVNLPSYPNRFVKPKYYNTSLENAPQGNGWYDDVSTGNKTVTFGLYART